VGVLTTLEGPMTAIGHESLRGVRLALAEVDEQVAGKRVRLFTGPTNSTPNSVMNAARRLIEQDRVQIVVGPASGSEVLALVQFAKEYPGITFLNGTAAAPEATYREPAENFFRFNAEGVDGLRDRPKSGRPTWLDDGQLATFKALVLRGPDPERDGVSSWRAQDLCRLVAARFGVAGVFCMALVPGTGGRADGSRPDRLVTGSPGLLVAAVRQQRDRCVQLPVHVAGLEYGDPNAATVLSSVTD
jgi:hypothetical protein